MKRTTRSATVQSLAFTAFAVVLLAGQASASRTELESRGLPRLLAVDSYNLSLLPATAVELDPQVQLDVGTSQIDNALGLVGSNWRFGYQLDGDMHHMVVTAPRGIGFDLGYRAESSQRKYVTDRPTIRHEDTFTESDFEVGMGVGWKQRSASNRLNELALHGSYLGGGADRETETQGGPFEGSGEGSSLEISGFAIDLVLRTLAADVGWSAALRFAYRDPGTESLIPLSELPGYLRLSRSAAGDLGHRSRPGSLDDLVLGITAEWEDLTLVNGRFESSRDRSGSALLFASVEEGLGASVSLRAGVRGGVTYNQRQFRVIVDDGIKPEDDSRSESWHLSDPEIRFGLGWEYRNLVLDAWIWSDIRLDSPVVTWAATFRFQ